MVTEITSEWEKKYDTNARAQPSELRIVDSGLVVRVQKAHLRGSDINGVFEVADVSKPFSIHEGMLRVEVKAGWFGMKPKTSWSHLTLNGDWELIRNYSGEVVHNLSAR